MTTVLIVDDDTRLTEPIQYQLETLGYTVAVAHDGSAGLRMVLSQKPDVVVLDVVMPTLNGVEATRQIVKEVPETKVLILSSYSDDERVLQLIEEGATGYLVKQTAGNDLLMAIREAHKGNAFFSPSISRRLLQQCRETFANGGVVKKRGNILTTREAEVLQLIAEGHPNKQIADQLSISIKTVEKHRQQVMNKLNIHDVAGLTRYAISKGLIERSAPAVV